MLCYEDIFPEISAIQSAKGARILINQTNDAWYGVSSAAYQHLGMSAYRAIENRLPLIRATNTGVTAHVSPTGEIKQTLPWFERGLLVVDLNLRENPRTFYSRHIEWFSRLSVILYFAFAMGMFVLRRKIGYSSLGLTKE